MTTAARTVSPDGGHWYTKDGQPAYEVPYADPTKGMRRTTLADARKLGLVPSVTTILRALHKQALVDWLIEQACLAVLTTPRKDGEGLDAFVDRVLHLEKVQDQESEAAKDRGTELHSALEMVFGGQPCGDDRWPWIEPACTELAGRGRTIGTEVVVANESYGGKIDLIQESDREVWLWDYKTSKKLPDPTKGGAWLEHRLQLSAYAHAWAKGDKPIRTGNVYISTVEPGKFVICEHSDWQDTYERGFKPLIQVWQFANNFKP